MSKKTTRVIKDSGNDYLIGVKGNQGSLYKTMKQILNTKDLVSSSYIEIQSNRGRMELRHVEVSDCIIGISKKWTGLEQLIKVHRIVRVKGKKMEETNYYISSRKSSAFLYAEGVRLHWHIENSLHYIKDVIFTEDDSRIRTGDAPQNISTIKNIALNIIRKNEYKSIKQAMRLLANDIKGLMELLQ